MSKNIALVVTHQDTCLSDFWSGHHLPHVAVPVWKNMSTAQLVDGIKSEIAQGAIAGADAGPDITEDPEWLEAARKAAERIAIFRKDHGILDQPLFTELDEESPDDCCESVYAYFTFNPCN